MRRFAAIVRATALEVESEPLSLLVLISALVLAIMAPLLHYHQFGEPTRMARDAGFSALFLGSLAFAIFLPIRVFVRERESGTMAMALAHATSRGGFFGAKLVGIALAQLDFALVVFATTLVVVEGARIGGEIANGDIARIYGPCAAIAFALLISPLVVGALLNRFANRRFVLSACRLAVWLSALALLGVAAVDAETLVRYSPVALLVIVQSWVFMALASALATRFRPNFAASASAFLFVLALPFVGNYYSVDALAKGGTLAGSYVALAILAALLPIVAFVVIGISLTGEGGE